MDLVNTLKYLVNLLLSQYHSSDPKTKILLLVSCVLLMWTMFGSYKLLLALAIVGFLGIQIFNNWQCASPPRPYKLTWQEEKE